MPRMREAAAPEQIHDLFFEQDVPVLATNYRHGLWYSVIVLARSLVFSRRNADIERPLAPNSTVAVVFFPNELEAVRRATAGALPIDRIIKLHPHRLSVVRATLGWAGMLRSARAFVDVALRTKGRAYAGRLTFPLLGWLLHDTFVRRLQNSRDVRVVTTNMQHPLSIGVARAAIDAGCQSIFFEHATTPRLVFKDRGYSSFHVQASHTGRMIESFGVDVGRVHVHLPLDPGSLPPKQRPVSRVGLCVNVLDPLEAVESASRMILARGLQLSYRIHDADPRVRQLGRLAARHGASVSNARDSRIESYLESVDLVVVGNSNVIADAILAGCHVVYYWTGAPEMFDYYGLVAHYGLPSARDAEALSRAISEIQVRPPVVV
jgi:hypothetical protein